MTSPINVPFLDIRAGYLEHRDLYDAAYARVMQSGRWILGDELAAFEAEFADLCGTRSCVGVANGLDALFLVLKALDIGPGDEVVVPAHTFIATWLAVQRTGATPVAVEPAADCFHITAEGVANAMTGRTRAVVPVHIYGALAEAAELAELCRTRGVHLVEDAAQAHGARIGDACAGSFGTAGCFSFYPSKNLGAFGDAGAIVTSDAKLDGKLRSLRNYGSSAKYRHDDAGVNSRLDELQAAFLRVGLGLLAPQNARRRTIAELYGRELRDIGDLRLPDPGPHGSHVWHLFVVRTAHRDGLQSHLAARACETLIHYPKPVYRYQAFESYGPADETVSDRLTSEILSLPIGPNLSDADAETVCRHVRAYFTNAVR